MRQTFRAMPGKDSTSVRASQWGPITGLYKHPQKKDEWWFTLWLFNIAMENGPFIDDFPIKTTIYRGFSMAMLNNQMVTTSKLSIFEQFMQQ